MTTRLPLPLALRGPNAAGLLALTLFLGTLPLWLNTPYALSTLVLIGIYTIATIGLCLLMGYAGQVSLGQAAFYGLGGYGSAVLTVRLGWSPWLALPVAAAGTGVLAYLVGIPIFRLRGHYLALATLALGAIIHIVMMEWKVVTGGPTGLPGIPRMQVGTLILRSDLSFYYLVWAVALVGLALALNLVNSRYGRALRAIHGSEEAAESLGVESSHVKLTALVVSAMYASVAGSLYAHYTTFVSPNAFSMDASIRLVLMAAVGGMASVWGAPLGAATVTLLTVALREAIPAITGRGSGEQQIIAYGILLVVIMLFVPEGLAPSLARPLRRVSQRVTGSLQARLLRLRRTQLERTAEMAEGGGRDGC
ncbi:MAG: branched-chain amino acid ABC transporter permease [Anaerolineae bacterium]